MIMSVFCQAVVYLLAALPAVAQSQAFSRITIKPAHLADPRNARVQVLPNGDLIASAVPLITFLTRYIDGEDRRFEVAIQRLTSPGRVRLDRTVCRRLLL